MARHGQSPQNRHIFKYCSGTTANEQIFGRKSYPRFCQPNAVPSSISVTLQPRGSSWFPGYYPGSPSPLRRDSTVSILRCLHLKMSAGETHSPCSQLHARLAGCIAETAGGLLPHPFTPYRTLRVGGNPFCCGCSQLPVTRQLPSLTVS